MKAGAAVVILLVLAAVTATAENAGAFPMVFLAAALSVVIGSAAYHPGYKAGQRDLIDLPHLHPLTEDQRTQMLMRATLPRWR